MPVRVKLGMRFAEAITVGVLAVLTGCGGGFFPPLTTTTGSGGGTTTTSSFAYVANATTSTIAGFGIATTTAGAGTLTAVSGSPYALTQTPTAMAITPSNSFLYAAAPGGIYGYSINGTTGVLTALNSGSALASSIYGEVSLDVSPDGQWLFALSDNSATLEQYQITAATGAIALIATPTYVGASGTQAVAKMVKVSPTGTFVLLALGTGGDIVIPFNTVKGALNVIDTSPKLPPVSTTTSDNALAVDANTAFLYIARSGVSGGVAVYAIGAGGSLTPVAGSPFAAGGGPFSVVLDSTGKYVYAANRSDNTISAYAIGTGGVLTALSGSPFASGGAVTSLARDNSKTYILAAAFNGGPDLTMYSFDATTPGKLDSAATAATGVDPTGATLVVTTH